MVSDLDDSNGYDNDCRRKSLTIYNTNTASIGSHDRLNDVEILTSR